MLPRNVYSLLSDLLVYHTQNSKILLKSANTIDFIFIFHLLVIIKLSRLHADSQQFGFLSSHYSDHQTYSFLLPTL